VQKSGTLVFKGRAFDGKAMHRNATLQIDTDSGTIVGFGERGAVEETKGARIIEGADLTALPGLIDAHVHFYSSKGSGIKEWSLVPDTLAVLRAAGDMGRLLRAGFTSVRELGSKGGVHLAQAVEEGALAGPGVVSCSRALSQTGGDDDPRSLPLDIAQRLASYTYFCDGPWECRRAVRQVLRDGGRVVKLYASGSFTRTGKILRDFDPRELEAIVDESHRAGLKVAAHANGEEALENVVRAGVDSIEHGAGLTAKIASTIAKRGIFYVPTLVTYAAIARRDLPRSLASHIRRHISEDMELAKDHGLLVVSGSDIVGDAERPHGRNYEEIVAIAKTHGKNEALVSATSRAAKCLDLPDVGLLKEGFRADVTIVKGDPSKSIQALAPESVEFVVKSGRLVFSRSWA